MPEDEVQTQQRSPITILSDDEGYLLEEEQQISKAEVNAETCREFFTSEIKAAKPNKKKKRIVTPYCRPKTRPTNKLRWNMKKMLNPKLNSKQETVLNDTSSNEEPEIGKMNSKKEDKVADALSRNAKLNFTAAISTIQ